MNKFSSFYTEQKYYDNDGKQRYRFIVSSKDIDRAGDSINVDGIDLSEYNRNPVVLYNHYGTPIGTSIVKKEKGILYGDVHFDEITEQSKITKRLIDAGTLKTASIGLEILERNVRALTDDEVKKLKRPWITNLRTIDKSMMLEWSIVDLPANINAEIQRCLEKGFDVSDLQKLYNENENKKIELLTKELNDMPQSEFTEKAGAVLSSKNKTKLNDAIKLINEVLDSSTPETDDTKQMEVEITIKDNEVLTELIEKLDMQNEVLKDLTAEVELLKKQLLEAPKQEVKEKEIYNYNKLKEVINAK